MKKNQWFASVVLSVLIASSGMAYAHDGDGNNDGGMPGDHEGCSKHHLSDAQRNLLHETMKKTFEQDKAQIQKLHDLHSQLHDVVAAPKFDAKAFESISARIQETHDQIHKDRVHAFASIAGQFTPEEREMIMRKAHGHKMHHHGHHDGEHAGWNHGGPGGPNGPSNWGPGNHGPDHGSGPDGWQSHQWQPQQPYSSESNGVTYGQQPDDRAYPPYKTGR